MNNFFSTEGRFFQLITKICSSVWLNILWFVCCIPIFTIGAATTSLYYVSLKLVKNEEGNITKQFFRTFKDSFKQSTIIWGILLAIGLILGTDSYVLYHIHSENVFWTICTALLIAVIIVYLIVILNIFPLLARFENTIRAMFFNSFAMGVRYLFGSIIMAVVHFAVYYIIIFIFTPLIIFGQGLIALICSWLISPVLEKIEQNTN